MQSLKISILNHSPDFGKAELPNYLLKPNGLGVLRAVLSCGFVSTFQQGETLILEKQKGVPPLTQQGHGVILNSPPKE